MVRKLHILLVLVLYLPLLSFSQVTMNMDLSDYQWKNRLVLLFSPTTTNDRYQQQVEKFKNRSNGFNERDLKVFHLTRDGQAFLSDHKIAASDVEQLLHRYRINPGRFTIVLIGKDGTEKLRQNTPLQVEKLFRIIDAMPMRQREMQQ